METRRHAIQTDTKEGKGQAVMANSKMGMAKNKIYTRSNVNKSFQQPRKYRLGYSPLELVPSTRAYQNVLPTRSHFHLSSAHPLVTLS